MNKKTLIIIGAVVGVALLGFGVYKFLTLKDFEFNKAELRQTEQTIAEAIQTYHQDGWEGIEPMFLSDFIAEYSPEELEKILKFLIGPNKPSDQYNFVLEEFSPPPADVVPVRTEISGVITQNSFPVSLGKFQLVKPASTWKISGFFGENSKGIEPLTTEEFARAKTVMFDFLDLASKSMEEAYDSTHDRFQDETNLNDFKRILAVLNLPFTVEPKCGYYFKAKPEELKEEIDQVMVLKNCKTTDEYALELTLLQKGEDITIGGFFVR